MRKYLFAVLAALVSVGVTMGAASAAVPTQGVDCNTGQSGLVNIGTTTCSSTATGLTSLPALGGLLGRPRPRWPYPGLPAGFPQLYDGNLLPLSGLGLNGVNQDLDVCAYGSYNDLDRYGLRTFGRRWRGVESRWFAVQRAQRMLALREAAGCGVTSVAPWQLRGDELNLGYYGGSGWYDVCDSPTFDSFQGILRPRLRGRWPGFESRYLGGDRGAWLNSFRQLHEQAGCPSVVVVPGAGYQQIEQPQVIEQQPQVIQESTPCGCSPVTAPSAPPVVVPQGVPNSGNSGLAPDSERVN